MRDRVQPASMQCHHTSHCILSLLSGNVSGRAVSFTMQPLKLHLCVW